MFVGLAHLSSRHPVSVVIGWVVATIAMLTVAMVGVGDGNLFDRTTFGAPTVNGAESTEVYETLGAARDPDIGPTLTLDIQNVEPSDPEVANALTTVSDTIAERDGVAAVTTPYGTVPGSAFDPERYATSASAGLESSASQADALEASPLVAQSGDAVLMTVDYGDIPGSGAGEHHEVDDWATAYLEDELPGARVISFSEPTLMNDFSHQVESDLIKGEAIALPVALVVMVLVFGGFLAASAPIIGALASIAGGLAVLFGFSYILDLDQASINVVTVLGIGLSIDYGLLIVSRYREELFRSKSTPENDMRPAVLETTMVTAGRTVFFSSVTVAISVAGMLIFDAEIIRGIGGAALGVVIMALLTALTLVPAVLHLYGHRLSKPTVLSRIPGIRTVLKYTADVSSDTGAFSRLAGRVQQHPWLVAIATTGLLLLLASPLASLQVRNSEVELLPVDNESREFVDTYAVEYPDLASPTVHLLLETSPEEADAWVTSDVLDVAHVTGATAAEEIPGTGLSTVSLYTDVDDEGSPDATDIVRDLRDLSAPFEVSVGGTSAIQVDFIQALADGAPWAVGLVVIATFVLMFLMTGSLLVPVKTLLINALSLAAAMGVLSWIFTEGHLEGMLGFTSTGGIETYVLVMVLAFGFGLAMDYEVFLLARIKELVDAGVDNDEAVRIGLQRSGRIITSAAAIIMLVFLGFAAGELLVIKQVGLGLAIAVFLDATLVRMLLVPATMTLLGKHNWWAPKPLVRIYEKYAVKH
ncbi:MMPL family transporter [Demequina sediminicola]|uniref:MMPL family transporter n=1 Tax=Demequina sediminicola TaxID=1095026 RepID=UPI0007859126|nr:MMPL family transporter [Demequina sediminicola]